MDNKSSEWVKLGEKEITFVKNVSSGYETVEIVLYDDFTNYGTLFISTADVYASYPTDYIYLAFVNTSGELLKRCVNFKCLYADYNNIPETTPEMSSAANVYCIINNPIPYNDKLLSPISYNKFSSALYSYDVIDNDTLVKNKICFTCPSEGGVIYRGIFLVYGK